MQLSFNKWSFLTRKEKLETVCFHDTLRPFIIKGKEIKAPSNIQTSLLTCVDNHRLVCLQAFPGLRLLVICLLNERLQIVCKHALVGQFPG